jgi:hypothetical protein
MALNMLESLRFTQGLPPVADYDAAGVSSDVINMENYNKVLFVIHKGVGTTGTGVLTIEACDNVTPDNTTAIPYRYREVSAADVNGTLTEAAAAGFTLTVGSNIIVLAEVDSVEVQKAGFSFVRATLTESADDPVLAGILVILAEPRYNPADADATVLA